VAAGASTLAIESNSPRNLARSENPKKDHCRVQPEFAPRDRAFNFGARFRSGIVCLSAFGILTDRAWTYSFLERVNIYNDVALGRIM